MYGAQDISSKDCRHGDNLYFIFGCMYVSIYIYIYIYIYIFTFMCICCVRVHVILDIFAFKKNLVALVYKYVQYMYCSPFSDL